MAQGWLQIGVFVAVVVALPPPLAAYMARVYRNERVFLTPVLGGAERLTYRVLGVDPNRKQDWKAYARPLIVFSGLFWLALYLILRTQGIHPFNPQGFHSGTWDVSFNTASSFVTNTNWQYYGGETTLSNFSQMAGLTVQNFVSAAVGMAVLAALIRGIINRSGTSLGNFWQDMVRGIYYILLPLSIVVALLLLSQGVLQTLGHAVTAKTLEGADQGLAGGRPRRLAGRDQAAGHQRRRILQRQLRDAVRERDELLQLRRAGLDPPHPRGAHLHVRANGGKPAPGVGDLRGDAGAFPGVRARHLPGRAARHRGAARGRRAHAAL